MGFQVFEYATISETLKLRFFFFFFFYDEQLQHAARGFTFRRQSVLRQFRECINILQSAFSGSVQSRQTRARPTVGFNLAERREQLLVSLDYFHSDSPDENALWVNLGRTRR